MRRVAKARIIWANGGSSSCSINSSNYSGRGAVVVVTGWVVVTEKSREG